MKNGFCALILLLCSACTSNSVTRQMEALSKSHVVIPHKQLDRRICSMFSDTLFSNRTIRLLNYIKLEGCTSCRITGLKTDETRIMKREEFKDVRLMYVAETPPHEKDFVYAQLCKARLDGTVYLDTCNAFRRANPHIPDNPLFHTFLLNDEDSVLLVGDPFKNEKMERLFLKVIERERERKGNKLRD